MNEKYELTEEFKEIETWRKGRLQKIKVHRIRALRAFAFADVTIGDLGGFVETKQNLSNMGDAWVYGDAMVFGNAWVCDDAEVYGNAKVFDNAWVCGNALVFDNAWVCGNAMVFDNAWVCGDAVVCDDARVYGDARVCDVRYYARKIINGEDF